MGKIYYLVRAQFELAQSGERAEASQARLYIELVKMLSRGCARGTFRHLHRLGILDVWLPELAGTAPETRPVR